MDRAEGEAYAEVIEINMSQNRGTWGGQSCLQADFRVGFPSVPLDTRVLETEAG